MLIHRLLAPNHTLSHGGQRRGSFVTHEFSTMATTREWRGYLCSIEWAQNIVDRAPKGDGNQRWARSESINVQNGSYVVSHCTLECSLAGEPLTFELGFDRKPKTCRVATLPTT